jgi:hypothetical protein
MSPLFPTLKTNLLLALEWKNQSIYNSIMAEIDQSNLTTDEIEELRSITLDEVVEEQIEPAKGISIEMITDSANITQKNVVNYIRYPLESKACLIDDPECEACQA